jgi:hypothetical protein
MTTIMATCIVLGRYGIEVALRPTPYGIKIRLILLELDAHPHVDRRQESEPQDRHQCDQHQRRRHPAELGPGQRGISELDGRNTLKQRRRLSCGASVFACMMAIFLILGPG